MRGRHGVVCGLVTMLWAAGAAVALGQSTTPAQEVAKEPGPADERDVHDARGTWVERLQQLDSDDPPRFRPLVGVIVPGSGVAVGVAMNSPRLGRGWGATVESMISVRNYHHLVGRVGLTGRLQQLPLLRPFDQSLWSMVEAGRAPEPGIAVFLEARYRHLPRIDLFGDTPAGLQRTDYGQRSWTTDIVARWQARPRLGLAARAGLMSTELFPGTNDGRVDTDALFGPALGFSRFATVGYAVAGLAAVFDTRDDRQQPSRGAVFALSSWLFAPTTAGLTRFARTVADIRGYRGLSPRHVLAGRLLAAADAGAPAQAIPFFLLPTLGGSTTMRSFSSYRFRGARLVTASVESRWDVARALELAPFLDVGHIARPPLSHDARGLLASAGVSVRPKWNKRVFTRTDVAIGRDGLRVSVSFDFERSF